MTCFNWCVHAFTMGLIILSGSDSITSSHPYQIKHPIQLNMTGCRNVSCNGWCMAIRGFSKQISILEDSVHRFPYWRISTQISIPGIFLISSRKGVVFRPWIIYVWRRTSGHWGEFTTAAAISLYAYIHMVLHTIDNYGIHRSSVGLIYTRG